MPLSMLPVKILVLLLAISNVVTASFGQDTSVDVRARPLLKFGGFPYFERSSYSGFSLHLSSERAFRKRQYFTSGPRIDYVNLSDFPDKNLSIGYEVKFYPFYWKHRQPYRGLYVSVEPLVLIKTDFNPGAKFGPGLGLLLGYQYLIEDKISLGLEACMGHFKNLNKEALQYPGSSNSEERYFYFLACFKVGFKI